MVTTPVGNLLAELHPLARAPKPDKGSQAARPAPQVDLPAVLAVAYDEGRAEGQRSAEEQCEAKCAVIVSQHAQEQAEHHRRLGAELGSLLDREICALEEAVGAQIAPLLLPILKRSIRMDALDSLVAQLRTTLRTEGVVRIQAEGPGDLLEGIRSAFESAGHVMEYVPSASVDLRVRIDEQLLETRIADWTRAIEALS